MIDVLKQIKPLLVFDSDDDFYYLQILQRKKENPELDSNSRVIKNYYIRNIEYLEKRYDEIKKLCNIFNARAMLRLNRRSYRKVAFKSMVNIANSLNNGEYAFTGKAYDRAVGQSHHEPNKKWIIDIDEKVNRKDSLIETIINDINNYQPIGNKLYTVLETKNGWHIVTAPFNVQEFKKVYKSIDIHKDNPINLYIP